VAGLAEAVAQLQGNGEGDEAELAELLSELEGLSEDEAQQLLASEDTERGA
jgi:hypothetical protein